ncbi:MAG: hypothetical protein QOF37_1033 [Thermoleophilaceae bacterium]|nr:hypothetical protein [Thermoleophilaceae bacterium]
MAARYRLRIREGPRVDRESFADRAAALAALESRGRELESSADAKPVSTLLGRDYEPVQQVLARLELRGPGVRAGVDVRGDGSSEAFTGSVRRRVVAQRAGESPYDALRRELSPRSA